VSGWPFAGPSGPCPLDSSPVNNVIKSHMSHTHNTITLKISTIHTITTMHMENQQHLPTILSKAINFKRQKNFNTTKTNLPTTRRIWMPRDEFDYHETNLNITSRIWIPRYGFEYHEMDLNTTKLIWIPRDGLNTTRRVWIPRDGFKYHETDLYTTETGLNTTRRI